jgi:hypothetical protein
MRFGWRATADDAGLRSGELAVLLVAQTNGLRCNATVPNNRSFRSRRLGTVEGLALFAQRLVARIVNGLPRRGARLPSLYGGEPFSEAGFDSFSIGAIQHVFHREVLVDPVGCRVGGFEIADLSDQSVAQGGRLVCGQHDPRRSNGFSIPTGARRDERLLISHRLRRRLNVETGSRIGVAARAKVWRASRSSSPAMPTRVNKAYRRA